MDYLDLRLSLDLDLPDLPRSLDRDLDLLREGARSLDRLLSADLLLLHTKLSLQTRRHSTATHIIPE